MSLLQRLRNLVPGREQILGNRWVRWMAPWLGHPRLWHWSRRGVAMGVAIGVFFGLLIPLAQIPVSAAAAIVLRANLPAAAASTLITNPATFGPVYYAAFRLGSWITGDTSLSAAEPASSSGAVLEKTMAERIVALGKPTLVGLSVMACFTGFLAYLMITLFWRWRTMQRWRTRRITSQDPGSSTGIRK